MLAIYTNLFGSRSSNNSTFDILFDDLEDSMGDAGQDYANGGDEWDQETQDILDSEEDVDDYENEL